ncbi:acyl-CoA dehydrogenase [Mycobacterium asiaticum]|uniref:Acyl-CoA dehydrogenase n=1 Tax=Mycobacterium asiaticum TaxID=1790 RepID=A0A1A3P3R0_MYCAS|nr:acyl-CoA dehydrogenase family protein [Mycobacterium asiaticum]OBK27924.1 acyl-CoA dehydrogenase [Mycobacterium asiaticum]
MADDNSADVDLDLDLLRASARRFLAERGETQSVKELAAMDWTGLLVDEAMGGAGWCPVETCVIAEELGRARDGSSWFGTALAAAALGSAPDQVRQQWLPSLLTGTATAGCTFLGDCARVVRDDADIVIILGSNGIHLLEDLDPARFELDADLLDVNRPVCRIDLTEAPSVAIGSPERAAELSAVARLLVAADSIGAVSATLERLTAYLKERVAFGVPIASFQAVQHRLVDLLVFEVKARAVVMKAARAVASGYERGREKAPALAAVAHAFVAANGTAAVDDCMQLSGGIGFTWEYPLHHELRRVFTNGHLVGTARSSRALLAEACGW